MLSCAMEMNMFLKNDIIRRYDLMLNTVGKPSRYDEICEQESSFIKLGSVSQQVLCRNSSISNVATLLCLG